MRKVIESVPKDASRLREQAAIEQELAVAYASVRARLARAADGYAIAAGAEHGQYLRFARALASETRVRVVPLITRGGEENLRLLREGKVSVALAQGDAALDAYEGKGALPRTGRTPRRARWAVCIRKPCMSSVRANDSLASMADLRGHKVAMGEPGSASRVTAVRVLEAACGSG
ncbi:TAXI family TRAP transporter solute-binding subunit [Cupriavidus basilensis]